VDHALATSARDEGPDGLPRDHSADESAHVTDGSRDEHGDDHGDRDAEGNARTVDADHRVAEARLAAAPSRGANG
jgi:hypothetical protein